MAKRLAGALSLSAALLITAGPGCGGSLTPAASFDEASGWGAYPPPDLSGGQGGGSTDPGDGTGGAGSAAKNKSN